jgi:hypothetical protein
MKTTRRIPIQRLRPVATWAAILLAAFFSLGCRPADAQVAPVHNRSVTGTTDWDQWKRNCSLLSDFAKKFLSCATSTVTARPFHFLVQSIVPASGVGGGGRLAFDMNEKNGAQDQLQATAVMTIRQFWYTELKFSSQRAIDKDWNPSGESLGINIYARNRSMPVMPFYGLGQNTRLQGLADFSERDTSAGVEVTTPFPEVSWLSAGGVVEGLWPSIGPVFSRNVLSITQKYNEQTAPGLAVQPPLVHEQIFLNPHKRFLTRLELDGSIAYNLYQDSTTGHYSFRRFEAMPELRFYPEKRKHGGVIEQNYFSVLWRYSAASTEKGNAIPFYLQETIGGMDINNETFLPAFKDYRFRGPNLMTAGIAYNRKICEACAPCKQGIIRTVCSHLGLVLDYDAGKVALSRSDLDFAGMHQSFGGGVSIYLGKDVVFRMAVGLGGGEGTHPYFNIANFL